MKYFWALLLAMNIAVAAALPTTANALSIAYSPPLIDDGDDFYFETVGNWSHFPLAGYNGDFVYAEPATGNGCHADDANGEVYCTLSASLAHSATWRFPYVASGKYQVWATWAAFPNLATDATYTMFHNGDHYEKTVNQQKKPGKKFDDGRWQKLATFDIAGELKVNLSNVANGYVAADAVRIVRIGDADPLPECSDGIDNDQDNLIDFPNDPDCESRKDDSESDAKVSIVKEGPSIIRPNEPVTYTMTIKNNHNRTLRKLRVVDATFVTNGMKIVPEKSSPECALGANGSAIGCGPYKLRKGQSKVITLTGIAPDYSCTHPDVSNTAAVQLRSLQTTDSSIHTADVQCRPVCGNGICEENEGPFGCDPYIDDFGNVNGCEDYTFCPEDCSIEPPICPIIDIAAPPPGCFYEWVENDEGCEIPKLVCEPLPCPVYDLVQPPIGCEYEWITNDLGCEEPNLVCKHECGNGICEEPETALQCITDSTSTAPGEPMTCPDTVYCPEDCLLPLPLPFPHPCPVYSLIEPPAGCHYEWNTNDQGCEEPNLVCEDTCGNGICELSESCQGTCHVTDSGETVCTDSCGPSYCAQDCEIQAIPVPLECPPILLDEAPENCEYVVDENDKSQCPTPTLLCHDDPPALFLEAILETADPEDIQSSETASTSSEAADEEE